MKLGFYGAAHEVTGSVTLIEAGDKKGVVDFGLEQGKDHGHQQWVNSFREVLEPLKQPVRRHHTDEEKRKPFT